MAGLACVGGGPRDPDGRHHPLHGAPTLALADLRRTNSSAEALVRHLKRSVTAAPKRFRAAGLRGSGHAGRQGGRHRRRSYAALLAAGFFFQVAARPVGVFLPLYFQYVRGCSATLRVAPHRGTGHRTSHGRHHHRHPNCVPRDDRGTATAGSALTKQIGGALGLACAQTLMSHRTAAAPTASAIGDRLHHRLERNHPRARRPRSAPSHARHLWLHARKREQGGSWCPGSAAGGPAPARHRSGGLSTGRLCQRPSVADPSDTLQALCGLRPVLFAVVPPARCIGQCQWWQAG